VSGAAVVIVSQSLHANHSMYHKASLSILAVHETLMEIGEYNCMVSENEIKR